MFALQYKKDNDYLSASIVDIPEYTLRRMCTHIPLTNAWIDDKDQNTIYVVFPRFNVKNPEDQLAMEEIKKSVDTVIYADKKKLQQLTKKDTSYKWKNDKEMQK